MLETLGMLELVGEPAGCPSQFDARVLRTFGCPMLKCQYINPPVRGTSLGDLVESPTRLQSLACLQYCKPVNAGPARMKKPHQGWNPRMAEPLQPWNPRDARTPNPKTLPMLDPRDPAKSGSGLVNVRGPLMLETPER